MLINLESGKCQRKRRKDYGSYNPIDLILKKITYDDDIDLWSCGTTNQSPYEKVDH